MDPTTKLDTPLSRTSQSSDFYKAHGRTGRIFSVTGGRVKILYDNLLTIEVPQEDHFYEALDEMEKCMMREYPNARCFHEETIRDCPFNRVRRHYARDGQFEFIPSRDDT